MIGFLPSKRTSHGKVHFGHLTKYESFFDTSTKIGSSHIGHFFVIIFFSLFIFLSITTGGIYAKN